MKFGDFRQRDNECLHHLYWYVMSARSVPTPHTVQVWSIVYRCQGHAKCLLLDKRTSPHFLFYINLSSEVGQHYNTTMGIFDMFRSKSKREELGHLKSLLALAAADGKVEKTEILAIAAICSREGITESELKRCLENPESIPYVKPTDDNTKIQYLKDMVGLMMVDGNINDNEMSLCKLTAELLGFRAEVIDAMILDIIVEFKKKMNE